MNPLQRLWSEHGQAVWLDFIQRSLLRNGGLASLIENDAVRGVTSNPSIFEKAIAGSDDYDEALQTLLTKNPSIGVTELYESLAVEDIQEAADILRPVFDESQGADGFVSLEVSPHLATNTAGTVDEARRLWSQVARPNLMIKVPATSPGVPAIETLIAEGINVNATLIFSLEHYEGVAAAYIRGLEKNPNPAQVASVASFFISRLDSVIDKHLEEIGSQEALQLRGKAAIANATVAYGRFQELFSQETFAGLKAKGAKVQRPLWASTSTKNPDYSDVLYVEELIGPDTVNTLPTATLEAFRDHGSPRTSLIPAIETAPVVLDELSRFGVDLDAVTQKLQDDGVAAFSASFDGMMEVIEATRKKRVGE